MSWRMKDTIVPENHGSFKNSRGLDLLLNWLRSGVIATASYDSISKDALPSDLSFQRDAL